jgi:hypothetical protein
MPKSFGGFRNALTIKCVCDECNSYLGRELDEYLARDTPEGLLRFRFNVRPAADYRSLGRRSTIVSTVDDGRLKGAVVWYVDFEGVLRPSPAPQVGFGTTRDGPFDWFPVSALPSREQVRDLFAAGKRCAEFLGIGEGEQNEVEIRAMTTQLGLDSVSEFETTLPIGVTEELYRIQDYSRIGPKFWRCIAKISLNYVAAVHGQVVALRPEFDLMREHIRSGTAYTFDCWRTPNPDTPERRQGDAYQIAVGLNPDARTFVGEVRLLSGARYRVPLALNASALRSLGPVRRHLYDLDTMNVRAA